MKTTLLSAIILLSVGAQGVASQEITTASAYFNQLSETYENYTTMEARIRITQGDIVMSGRLSYVAPDNLRIDFDEPEEQVLLYDGKLLQVYLPELDVTLNQSTTSTGAAGGGVGLATGSGLALMRDSFTPRWTQENGSDFVPLEDGSDLTVRVLEMRVRNRLELYQLLYLYVDQSNTIRRIEGTTLDSRLVVMEFNDVVTNIDIPAERFVYDSPADSNNLNNFLFTN